MLRDVLKNKPNKVDVVKLQKSGGVVSRNAKVRQKARSYRIRVRTYSLVIYVFLYVCKFCCSCYYDNSVFSFLSVRSTS